MVALVMRPTLSPINVSQCGAMPMPIGESSGLAVAPSPYRFKEMYHNGLALLPPQ
jgi:hypothetical protein